ncbi:Pycsar system effector family protein [Nonomuraea sp. NPDC050478]|uniref:Pycsar system effector family protein n=1 Tax=Nonomuraea sp. NPDC050478 TaxID=3364365 RepID=UPI0037B8B03A
MFGWTARPKVSRKDRDARALVHATRLFGEAREELNRADTKAQVLLGVAGVGVGAVTGGFLAGNWSPLMLDPGVRWLWWCGAACALGALFCLANAVYPRLTHRAFGITYFGDVRRYRSTAEITDALRESDSEGDLAALAEQIRVVSMIVTRKYGLIRWGFWLLLVSVVATVGSSVVQLFL